MEPREQLSRFIAERGIPRRQVAAAIGKSQGLLSRYLSGKYKEDGGNVGEIDQAVLGWMERMREKALAEERGPVNQFAMTRQAKAIFGILKSCHIEGQMGVIISKSGLGKTEAIREYCQKTKGVILITCRKTVALKVLLERIAEQLGISDKGVNDYIVNSVIEILKNSGRMIVVDEAQFLTTICLEILRQIYDEAGIGVVYAGMPELRDKIVGRGAVKLEQIYSRISFAAQLPPLDEHDVRLILEATHISIDPSAIKIMTELCEGSGRRLMNIFKKACREADGRMITRGLVESAYRKLIAQLRWGNGSIYKQNGGETADETRMENVLPLSGSKNSAIAS